jgi:hypothetical protein
MEKFMGFINQLIRIGNTKLQRIFNVRLAVTQEVKTSSLT